MIREKIKAALIHALVTLFVALISAAVIFGVWYPNSLANYLGGVDLYLIILGVEICLGPVMSLVIFNSKKARKELVLDYSAVALIQLAAFCYGLHSAFLSRPVYSVFVVDRVELISAVELGKEQGHIKYGNLPLWGMDYVCVSMPADPAVRSNLIISALQGKDIELMPEYYRPCKDNEQISAAKDKNLLLQILKDSKNEAALAKLKELDSFKWLPVKSRFGAWVEIYPNGSFEKRFYLNVDPYLDF